MSRFGTALAVALAIVFALYPFLLPGDFYERMGAEVLLAAIGASAWNILGGFGSVPGAMYAGLIIGLIQALSAFYLGPIYKDIVVYALFAGLLWFRPQGLLGKA